LRLPNIEYSARQAAQLTTQLWNAGWIVARICGSDSKLDQSEWVFSIARVRALLHGIIRQVTCGPVGYDIDSADALINEKLLSQVREPSRWLPFLNQRLATYRAELDLVVTRVGIVMVEVSGQDIERNLRWKGSTRQDVAAVRTVMTDADKIHAVTGFDLLP
jgi:hypothetical protein